MVKKTLLTLMLVLTATGMWAQKNAYTVLSPDGLTLTYYYDAEQDGREGAIKDPGYHDQMVTKVVFDASFAEARPTSTASWFSGMTSLKSIVGINNLNTSEVQGMQAMFADCSNLTALDLNSFDTSNVTNFYAMFSRCSSLSDLDLTSFDTSKVRDFNDMFSGCSALTSLDLTSFTFSLEPAGIGFFRGCSSLKCLKISESAWQLNNNYAFQGVGTIDSPCKIIAPENNFYNVETLGDYFMWKGGYFFDEENTYAIKPYVVQSDEKNALTYYYDDQYAARDGKVIRFLPSWNLTAGDYDRFSDINHVVFDASFSKARPTSTASWFSRMKNLKEIEGMENLNTGNVTNMEFMFYDCSSLTSLDVSHFDTGNVTKMEFMFCDCSSLTSLDVSHFDTGNVTNMIFMFCDCSSLTSLDVSHFDTTKALQDELFTGCSGLQSLSLSSSMSSIGTTSCENVGTSESPCLLIIPEGFELGDVEFIGAAFSWKNGWFRLPYLEMSLDENAQNELPAEGRYVDVVNTHRTFVEGVWNTLCLPFSISAGEMADEGHPLHGATIKTLSEAILVSGISYNLSFDDVTSIEAGLPYLVKVPSNVSNPTFNGVVIGASEPKSVTCGDWTMWGIYNAYTFTSANTGIFFITGVNTFSYVAEPGTMKGMRAYFEYQGAAEAANVTATFDDATGLSIPTAISLSGDIYDLQGRKLNVTPTHGVYISCGRKYVK